MTLLRDLARFNVSNCSVVANNRVYLLSYSVELFVVLQQHRLCVQSNAGDQRALPHTGSPTCPSVFRLLTGPRESPPRGVACWERDERRLEGDAPARTRICPSLRLPHTPPTTLVAYRAVHPSDQCGRLCDRFGRCKGSNFPFAH